MRFGIFSDIHIHNWTAFSKTTKGGLNSRLVGITNLLRRMLSEFEKANVEAVLFTGDLFHVKKIDIETYDLTARVLKSSKLPIIMIPGNHDEADKMADFHSLRAMGRKSIHVLDSREGNEFQMGGLRIVGIPYCPNKQDMLQSVRSLCKKRTDILLLHTGFAGATMEIGRAHV